MKFSQTEFRLLEQIAQGNTNITGIADTLKRSEKQIYRVSQKLADNGILDRFKGILELRKATHITLFLQLLAKYPNLVQILSGSGLQILTAMLKPKTVDEIMIETGLKKSIIYKKIKQSIDISVVIQKEKEKYVLNKKLWNKLNECLEELKKFEDTTDPRVPANSFIYYKTDKEIVFSNKVDYDATLTGFSTYENYGIKLLLPTRYYYLPRRELTKEEVFLHSIYITEKEKDIRYLTYLALFYAKFKRELDSVKHPMLEKIKNVLNGKHIEGYPTFEDIKEKAELYDIRF